MRHVLHVLSVAQPDHVRKVALDDAVAIAVKADVHRNERRIALADHHLARDVRGRPMNLHGELGAADDAGSHERRITDLREKLERAPGLRGVAGQPSVRKLRGAARDGASDDLSRAARRSRLAHSPSGSRAM